MSDDWIVLVPEDPYFVPDLVRQSAARNRLAALVPAADEIVVTVSDVVQFFDCGSNFEQVFCPSCLSELPRRWWEGCMGEDSTDGFRLDSYRLPCCGNKCPLHQLVYDWPQAFGRFSLEAMNPDVGRLHDNDRRVLEEVLGTKLLVVYQHV
ncbi:MAG: hypothetical protein NT069_09645 [Planctomycetota bacterium]|nr:hypothetical protein [Planctomycetota bacterium]